jgi:uncharacterized protein
MKLKPDASKDLSSQFDYDKTLPLQLEEHATETNNRVSVLDLSYASPTHGRVKAYWVAPSEGEQFASVLFVHPGPGNRSNFLEEAKLLAKRGVASLLIEAPWAALEVWGPTMGEPSHDKEEFRQLAIDLRRAVDVIETRPNVDTKRIGYVGHSYGALFGGVLSGVEKRLHTFILMAGVGSFSDVAAANIPTLTGQVLEQYRQVVNPIDPIHYIAQSAPAPLFFQFGKQDDFFSHRKFVTYTEAASEPKLVKWYEADHYSLNEVGRENRIEWLTEQLELESEE